MSFVEMAKNWLLVKSQICQYLWVAEIRALKEHNQRISESLQSNNKLSKNDAELPKW